MKKLKEILLSLLLYYLMLFLASIYLTSHIILFMISVSLGTALLVHFKKFTWWVLVTNTILCVGINIFGQIDMYRRGITEGFSYAIADAVWFGLLICVTVMTVFGYLLYICFNWVQKRRSNS